MVFVAHTTNPTMFEKPIARKPRVNLAKACVGFVIAVSMFCIDSLLTAEADNIFANLQAYVWEIVAVVIFMIAGLLSMSGSTMHPKKDVAVHASSGKAEQAECSFATTENSAVESEAELHNMLDKDLEPMELGLEDKDSMSSMGDALHAIKTELQGRLHEALKPVKTELHVRIGAALSPMDADSQDRIDLQDWADDGLSPTDAVLQETVGRALDPVEFELEDMIDQALNPTEAEVELQARIDQALNNPVELSDTLEEALIPSEVELQNLMDAAQKAMDAELDERFEETLKPMKEALDSAEKELQESTDMALFPMEVDLQDMIDKSLEPTAPDLLDMLEVELPDISEAEENLDSMVLELPSIVEEEALDSMEVQLPDISEAEENLDSMVLELPSIVEEEALDSMEAELPDRGIDEPINRSAMPAVTLAKVAVVTALILMGCFIDTLKIDPSIVETGGVVVSMAAGYYCFRR